MPKGYRHAFAVVRIDDFFEDPISSDNVQERVTVKKVMGTPEAADAEVERLNRLAAKRGPGVTYFSCLARVPDNPADE